MSDTVRQIKDIISIEDLVGEYVELKRAGKNLKAKSPFTNEKTPSFYVSPDRGMYYCFSSQKGGDIFTFVEEMEGVDFKGALKILAEKANIELVPEDPKKRDARETQYALIEETTKYFFSVREETKEVDKYLKDRGVEDKSVHIWRIGYAKDEWRALRTHLAKKGFSDDEMLKAGLIKKADQGKEPYDLFRDRIMFPIMDSSGRVVAFSGRTLKQDKDIPKYVNSPETELFQKSEILYGYDKAKQGIRQLQFSLIVEGQFDLVMSHQAGYSNTVAVSGTALTPFHISILMRMSPNAVLALDADRAGINAVKRSAVPILEAGMDVKVAQIPEGEDPADVVQNDPKELKKIVGKSVHVIEFLLKVLKDTTKDERTYKLRVREEILPLLIAIENRIDREHFEGIIAEHIDSTKDGVHFEVNRLEEDAVHKRSVESREVEDELKTKNGRKYLLENHLRAYIQVLSDDNSWLKKRIISELKEIVDKDLLKSFTEEVDTEKIQAECFELEKRIEEISERELLEEISDALTQYAHLVAKERLNLLHTKLVESENKDGHDKTLEILKDRKNAEKLVQAKIEIENPNNPKEESKFS